MAVGGDPWGLRPRLGRLLVLMTVIFAVLVVVGHDAPRFWLVPLIACLTGLLWTALLVPPRPRAPRHDGHPVLRWATWRRVVLSAGCAGILALPSALPSDPPLRIAALVVGVVLGIIVWLGTAGRVRLTQDGIEPLGGIKTCPAVAWSAIRSVTPTAHISWSANVGAVMGPSGGVLLGAGRPWPIRVVGVLDGYPEFLATAFERVPAAFDPLEPRERDRLARIGRLSAAGPRAGAR